MTSIDLGMLLLSHCYNLMGAYGRGWERAGVNQQPPMHQFRMRPFKLF
jgi:hypothetical protein